jgi:hypothetical protein
MARDDWIMGNLAAQNAYRGDYWGLGADAGVDDIGRRRYTRPGDVWTDQPELAETGAAVRGITRRIDPERFSDAVSRMPESENIERGKPPRFFDWAKELFGTPQSLPGSLGFAPMGSTAGQSKYAPADPVLPPPRNPARDIPEAILPNLSRPETWGPQPPPTMETGPGGKVPTSDPRLTGGLVDLANTAYTAIPMKGPAVAAPLLAAGLRRGVLTGARDVAEAVPQGIRAYHSSPHDFERFDLSKIGTGEGAQVYGHGIYLAENPAVSGQGGQYWQQFKGRFGGNEAEAVHALQQAGFDRNAAIARLDKEISGYIPDSAIHTSLSEARKLLESGKPVGPRTYEVDIKARPEQFLDWDKPLKEQPVAEAVRAVVPRDLRGPFDANVESGISGANAYHNYVPGERFSIRESRTSPYAASNARTMENALQAAGNDPSRVLRIRDPSYVSGTLNEAGIPGIRYLDQGSRVPAQLDARIDVLRKDLASGLGDHRPMLNRLESLLNERARYGDPTSNYVVFDPARIDIRRKYGLAGASMVPPAMGALARQDQYQQ